jgi:hypothetical protein
MIGVTIDNKKAISAYTEAFRRLQRMTGFDHRRVLRAEAGSILKTWAGRTKVATQAKADRRARLKAMKKLGLTSAKQRGDVTINAGFKRNAPFGRVWIKVRHGSGRKNFLLALGPNYSSPTGTGTFNKFGANQGPTTQEWIGNIVQAVEDAQREVPAAIQAGRRAIGIARQSVIQIADSLGIDLLRVPGGGVSAAGIAKARAALASNGRRYRNGTGRQGGNEVKAYVDLFNFLPYNQAIGMDRVLLGVMAGRAKFIEKSYEKGVFDTERGILKAFPGLFEHYAKAA